MLFTLLSVLLDSAQRAWLLLGALSTLTIATVVLVAIVKPFRGVDDGNVVSDRDQGKNKDANEASKGENHNATGLTQTTAEPQQPQDEMLDATHATAEPQQLLDETHTMPDSKSLRQAAVMELIMVAEEVESVANSALLAELRQLKPSQLKKRAVAAGSTAQQIEDAEDADDTQAALMELIMAAEEVESVANSALLAELRQLKPSQLKKRAVAAGSTAQQIEDAEDADDTQAALMELIMAAEEVESVANSALLAELRQLKPSQQSAGELQMVVQTTGVDKTHFEQQPTCPKSHVQELRLGRQHLAQISHGGQIDFRQHYNGRAQARTMDSTLWRELQSIAQDDATFAAASGALGFDPAAGWTRAQFDTWCQARRQSLNDPDKEWHAHSELVAGFQSIQRKCERDQAVRQTKDKRDQAARKLADISTDSWGAGDRSMVVAQIIQLLNYGVAAICLRNKEIRSKQGEAGTSDGVAVFATIMGFLFIFVAVGDVVRTYIVERKEEKKNDSAQDDIGPKESARECTSSSMSMLQPEPEPELGETGQVTLALIKNDTACANRRLQKQHALSNVRYATKVAEKRRARNRTEGDFSRSSKEAIAKAAASNETGVAGNVATRLSEVAHEEEVVLTNKLEAMRTQSTAHYAKKVAAKRRDRGRTIGDFARRSGVPERRRWCKTCTLWLSSKC
eukprot:COSAG02_NODE_5041_length_4701_cov_154.801391_4_plen_682_part_01